MIRELTVLMACLLALFFGVVVNSCVDVMRAQDFIRDCRAKARDPVKVDGEWQCLPRSTP